MSSEGFLVLPYRGGFAIDDDAHVANIRKLETWSRAPKGVWSWIDRGVVPPAADHKDGTVVFVDDVLYVHQLGAWTPILTGGGLTPTGGVILFGGTDTPPPGWLLCDGTAVSRTTYAALFAIVGTNFGTGDGVNTFNLPSMNTRYPKGTTGTPGSTGGAASHDHPSHNHGSTGNASANHSHDTAISTTFDGTHGHGTPTATVPRGTAAQDAAGPSHGHGNDGSHQHSVIGTTSGESVTHTHTTSAVGAGATSTEPLFQTFRYLIKT